MVEVCAVVTQGMLDHFVSVQLSTMDGSAGEFEPKVIDNHDSGYLGMVVQLYV